MTDPTFEPVDYDPFWSEATGGVPLTQDDYAKAAAKLAQTWPVRMAKGIWSGMMAPGDVLSGKLDRQLAGRRAKGF